MFTFDFLKTKININESPKKNYYVHNLNLFRGII